VAKIHIQLLTVNYTNKLCFGGVLAFSLDHKKSVKNRVLTE